MQWCGLQYAAGLRALGVEVFWLDLLGSNRTREHAATAEQMIEQFQPQFERFHLGDHWAVRYDDQGAIRYFGMSQKEVTAVCADCDLLINLSGHLQDDDLLGHIKRRAYIDLDPGFTQIWANQVEMGLHKFNLFFTVGWNVARSDFPVPARGIQWQPFFPPVALDFWPMQTEPPIRPFTTVAQWRGENASWGNDHYGPKRDEFVRFIDLPNKASQELELALLIHPSETEDIDQLRQHHWLLTDPYQVARGMHGFEKYVRGSRGEFSVAKQGYVKLRSGWFSDRTACYLASGRPALVQDTGFSEHLPTGEGLLAFSTMEEAVRGLNAIHANYAKHCAAARDLAVRFFSAAKVLLSLLERSGVGI